VTDEQSRLAGRNQKGTARAEGGYTFGLYYNFSKSSREIAVKKSKSRGRFGMAPTIDVNLPSPLSSDVKVLAASMPPIRVLAEVCLWQTKKNTFHSPAFPCPAVPQEFVCCTEQLPNPKLHADFVTEFRHASGNTKSDARPQYYAKPTDVRAGDGDYHTHCKPSEGFDIMPPSKRTGGNTSDNLQGLGTQVGSAHKPPLGVRKN
jgi:hypothetical protein